MGCNSSVVISFLLKKRLSAGPIFFSDHVCMVHPCDHACMVTILLQYFIIFMKLKRKLNYFHFDQPDLK